MNGQQLSYEEKKRIAKNFIVNVDPYGKREPLRFDMRRYAQYVKDNNIPVSEITEETMQMFVM